MYYKSCLKKTHTSCIWVINGSDSMGLEYIVLILVLYCFNIALQTYIIYKSSNHLRPFEVCLFSCEVCIIFQMIIIISDFFHSCFHMSVHRIEY